MEKPDSAEKPDAGPIKPGFRFVDFVPGMLPWGLKATMTIGFRVFDDVDSSLWLHCGGAWTKESYYRNRDGSLYRGDLYPGVDSATTDFHSVFMPWGVGIQQGLHFNPERKRNDLNLLLAWRGYWYYNLMQYEPANLLSTSSAEGRDWNLLNLVQLDLSYDGTFLDHRSNVKRGWALDVSGEYAPPGWSRPASAHYLQLDCAVSGFLPLYESWADNGFNLFSLYLAGHAVVDGIIGFGNDERKGIPYVASQQFGGIRHRDGLGGVVRGLGDGWGDGAFKAAGSLELRCNLPAFIHQDLFFGVLAFLDAGTFANPPGAPANSSLTSSFNMSTGLGLYYNFFGKYYLVVHTDLLLVSPNYQGKFWSPIDVEFGMHF